MSSSGLVVFLTAQPHISRSRQQQLDPLNAPIIPLSFHHSLHLIMSCNHSILHLTPSPFAELAGYEQPSGTARAAAETKSGRAPAKPVKRPNETFPGPLVLPHDDLNYDPDCAPQSVKSWHNAKARNKMTDKSRNTLYVGRVPTISKEVDFMRSWTVPKDTPPDASSIPSPDADLFAAYLTSFYHGMNVAILPTELSWNLWDAHRQPSRSVHLPKHIALAHGKAKTRIRVRAPPDGLFAAQLNLDDIIDAAIEMLPADAYALVLLIDHDMYESEDDDFCCGRAYGGSRVAVVQSARYLPSLDAPGGVDREHMWPMSHCKAFMDGLCKVEDVQPKGATKKEIASSKAGPMRAAVEAARLHPAVSDSVQDVTSLWLSRLARTVSHELGHCLGIGHCTYYACNMQGTAGMLEDLRQPPYLCPVCEVKVGTAIAGELHSGGDRDVEVWARNRCEALRGFCANLEKDGMTSAMWRGLDGWLEDRLKAM